jgi:hypothetical protein
VAVSEVPPQPAPSALLAAAPSETTLERIQTSRSSPQRSMGVADSVDEPFAAAPVFSRQCRTDGVEAERTTSHYRERGRTDSVVLARSPSNGAPRLFWSFCVIEMTVTGTFRTIRAMISWLLSRSRALALLSTLAALPALAVAVPGCSEDSAPSDPAVESGDGDQYGSSEDPVTAVDSTQVKRQSIGNCWLYATVGWAESLHKSVDGENVDLSESYLTYWHWFDQIANGGGYTSEISTGGSWSTAAGLIDRYGLMLEGDFIPSEEGAETSYRQSSALNAINASLKSGALKDASARRNRETIRQELDKAWGLSATIVANLDQAFGKKVDKTLTSKQPSESLGSVIRPSDLSVSYHTDLGQAEPTVLSLKDAIGNGSYYRSGEYVWGEANFPSSEGQQRRDFYKRVQRALADKHSVVISWFVDFNALTPGAAFSKEYLDEQGPGHQGGHMTNITDYEIDNVPGFGTLKAGVDATPEQLEAALDDAAVIKFLRVKNSWGAERPDRVPESQLAGYYDLNADYLAGPNQKCKEVNGTADPNQCSDGGPALWDVVLPPNY